MMRKKIGLAGVVVSFFLVAACAQTQEAMKTDTGKGVAIGAAGGALAGAIIGHQSGHRGAGALIGAATGAAIGGAIGHKMDQQKKELEQIPNTSVQQKEDRLVVTMSNAILFDVNSAAVKPGSRATLDQMAEVMMKYPDTDIIVQGHTDSSGSEQYNQDLSERRATAVKNYLITKGVPANSITAIGFGETMPIASNDTAEGREQNRRVEIEIKPRPESKS